MSVPAACRPASATTASATAPAAHRALAGVLILLLTVVLAGCGRREDASESSNVAARVTIHPTPAVVGPARIVMLLADPSNTPIAGAAIHIEGTMSHAGMAPVIRDAVEIAEGQYTVDEFEFTMAGDWILIVDGTTAAGDPIRKEVDIGTVGTGSPSIDAPLAPSERCYSTPTLAPGE